MMLPFLRFSTQVFAYSGQVDFVVKEAFPSIIPLLTDGP
jgi:hypothetical protein